MCSGLVHSSSHSRSLSVSLLCSLSLLCGFHPHPLSIYLSIYLFICFSVYSTSSLLYFLELIVWVVLLQLTQLHTILDHLCRRTWSTYPAFTAIRLGTLSLQVLQWLTAKDHVSLESCGVRCQEESPKGKGRMKGKGKAKGKAPGKGAC